MSKPVRVRVRMYQVGFGDCFLVSVEYDKAFADGRKARHLLIDFGTTGPPRPSRPPRAPGTTAEVAELIKQHTGGELDALVVTHRHKDHLSGFGDAASAAIMATLKPRLVLRPWTENPTLPSTADGPSGAGLAETEPSDGPPGTASARYARLLAAAQGHVHALARAKALGAEVQEEAEEQLPNADAVRLLDELAGEHGGRYLFAGADAGLEDAIPGLTATVLGPPTVEQDAGVGKQKSRDPQYWMLRLGAAIEGVAKAEAEAPSTRPMPLGPGPVRWLVTRLAKQRSHSAARLVRDLDDALNNTSLILLLKVGGLSMLFPGDAQIENWRRTLAQLETDPVLKHDLTCIDLYKVGHHGSRNATPRSLHALWEARPDDLPKMTSLMSTRPGKHGTTEATAVPRSTLVAALEKVSTVYSTDDLGPAPFLELEADARRGPFRQPFKVE